MQGFLDPAPAFVVWKTFSWLHLNSGRLSAYWQEIIKRDPYMRNVAMVIELALGGPQGTRTVRISTVTVRSVSGKLGTNHDALPHLIAEPELTFDYTFGDGTSAAKSAAFTLSNRVLDAADYVQRGYSLAGVAEISLEPIDRVSDYDRRLVLLRGDLAGGVNFGALQGVSNEIVDLEVVDPKESVQTKLPPWVVGGSGRFPDANITGQGKRIPIVINGYQHIPAVRTTDTTTGENTFVFAQGHGFTVTSTLVNGAIKPLGDATYGHSVVELTDETGLLYSAINFTNVATVWVNSDSVHVTCTRADNLGPVDVVRRIVEEASAIGIAGAHPGLFAHAAARFPVVSPPSVLINASGDSAPSATGWIEDAFLASFPMLSMVWEGGAYGPILTDFRTSPLADWVAGSAPLMDREGSVQETPKGEIGNEFVLRYDYDPLLDSFGSVVIRGADNSDLCKYSLRMFGERHEPEMESVYITNDSQAAYVIDWLVEHKALPSYLVSYVAMPRVVHERIRGDTILLTDSELGWVKERATIQSMTLRRGHCVVTFRVWLRYLDYGAGAMSV